MPSLISGVVEDVGELAIRIHRNIKRATETRDGGC